MPAPTRHRVRTRRPVPGRPAPVPAQDQAVPEPAPATEQPAPRPGPRPGRRPALARRVAGLAAPLAASRRRLAGLALAALLATAVTAGLGWWLAAGHAAETARAQVLPAAKARAAAILSYDYRTLRDSVAAVERQATGQFLAEYRATAPQLLQQAPAARAVVQATVGAAAVVRASGAEAVVLLYVDQITVRGVRPQARIDQSRIRMTLRLVGSEWLVSRVEAL